VIKNVIYSSESDLNKLIIIVKREFSVTLMSMKSATELSVHCITVTAAEMTMLNDVLRHLNFNIISLLSVMLKQSLTLNSVYHCQYTSINV